MTSFHRSGIGSFWERGGRGEWEREKEVSEREEKQRRKNELHECS